VIRLHIVVEGRAELNFVRRVLAPHLGQASFGVMTDARMVLTSKDNRTDREYRGGLTRYQKAQADILTWMKEDKHPECRFTTMFDLYALPNDFPGLDSATGRRNPYERVQLLEKAFAEDINHRGFIPYIQLHEFETLILCAPQKLSEEYAEHNLPIQRLVKMVGTQNPEVVDDGEETAPSKRILREIPEYDKATAGVSAAESIGLKTLREKCRHFNDWVSCLERLGD
jgi:hypothetical protein